MARAIALANPRYAGTQMSTTEPKQELPPPPRRKALDDPANRGLLGLLVALVILGLGWIIVDHLSQESSLQECIMAGRRDCARYESR